MKKSLGQMVKEAREARGINQRDLANSLSITQRWVSELERGELTYPPAPQLLNKVATMLELSMGELLVAAGYDINLIEPDIATRHRIVREMPPIELFAARYGLDEEGGAMLDNLAKRIKRGEKVEGKLEEAKESELP